MIPYFTWNQARFQLLRLQSAGFLRWHISNYKAMDIVHGIVCFGIFDREKGNVLGAIGAGEHDDLHEMVQFIENRS